MTKKKLRDSIFPGALEYPFFNPEYVIDWYGKNNNLNVADTKERMDAEEAIAVVTQPSPTAIRGHCADICDTDLKTRTKVYNDLPLAPGADGTTMTVEDARTFARTAAFSDATCVLSFEMLKHLHTAIGLEIGSATAFDGYLSLDLVVWFLSHVALKKNLVRTAVWVCCSVADSPLII